MNIYPLKCHSAVFRAFFVEKVYQKVAFSIRVLTFCFPGFLGLGNFFRHLITMITEIIFPKNFYIRCYEKLFENNSFYCNVPNDGHCF